MISSGVYHEYKATKPLMSSRYASAQKRCNFCNIFKGDDLFCPCCNMRLRHHPRNRIYKEKILKAPSQKLKENNFSKKSIAKEVTIW